MVFKYNIWNDEKGGWNIKDSKEDIDRRRITGYRLESKVFYQGDCIEVMKSQKINPQLIITDPPYNIGWKYSDKVNDKKKDYHEWCLEWAELCLNQLSPNGVMCIINYAENNNILYTRLVEKGYNFIQQLIWNYPTNVGQSKNKYTRSYRTILVFSKSKTYFFNAKKGEYKNPSDKRIKERISLGHAPNHYDIFEYNLCKNISKDKKNIGINQLPKELVEMLVETYSEPLDTILDPFVGNGTVIDVAFNMCRGGVGIDINSYLMNEDEK